MKKILGIIFLVFVIGFDGWVLSALSNAMDHSQIQQPSIAYGNFNPTGGGTYRLGQSLGTTNTTIKLSSFTEPVSGIPYTMTYLNSSIGYGTIDPQSSRSEFIAFTGISQNTDGSATLTGVSRGLTRTPAGNACTASTTLAQAHPGQSIFILSDSPCLFQEYYVLRNNATSTGILVFSSTTPPRYDSVAAQGSGSYIATTSEFASVAYVNSIAVSGAPNASISTKGIVQLATARQAASSTGNGSSGAVDVLQSSYATDTPGTLCATSSGGCVVMSLLNGFISQTWLGLSNLFTFTGGLTSTATTTLTGTTTASAATIGIYPMQSVLASTTIAAGKAVFIATSTGAVQLSDPATDIASYFDGFSKTSGINGSSIIVQTEGLVSGLSGLATGTVYYISTAGALTSAPAGNAIQVGTALSATTLLIQKSYENYVGSLSITAVTSAPTSCASPATTNIGFYRKVLVSVSITNGGAVTYGTQWLTLYKFGLITASWSINSGSDSVVGSAGITGQVVTISGSSNVSNANYACSGTAYFFR